MSMAISPQEAIRPAVRKRRPRRRQIPSQDVTEGRAQGVVRIAKPPRRVGKGGKTYAEKRQVSDQVIEDMDAAGDPQWKIAAVVNLTDRQVRNRLKAIRARRVEAREILDMMADTTIYG